MLAQARGYSHSPRHPSRGGLFQKDLRLLTFLDRRGLSRGIGRFDFKITADGGAGLTPSLV
jgi:hypothetical protein